MSEPTSVTSNQRCKHLMPSAADCVFCQRDKAVRTLELAGYTDCGGELWKPPLGKNPLPELDRLREALERYGHHTHPNCHDLTLNPDDSFGPRNGCLCGFDAALSGRSAGETKVRLPYGHLNLDVIREHVKTCDRNAHPCGALLAEVDRLRDSSEETKPLLVGKPAIDRLARWLIHEDDCAAVDGSAPAFENPCSCGLDDAIVAVQGSPQETSPPHRHYTVTKEEQDDLDRTAKVLQRLENSAQETNTDGLCKRDDGHDWDDNGRCLHCPAQNGKGDGT